MSFLRRIFCRRAALELRQLRQDLAERDRELQSIKVVCQKLGLNTNVTPSSSHFWQAIAVEAFIVELAIDRDGHEARAARLYNLVVGALEHGMNGSNTYSADRATEIGKEMSLARMEVAGHYDGMMAIDRDELAALRRRLDATLLELNQRLAEG